MNRLITLVLLLASLDADAAPSPCERRPPRGPQLSRERLVGEWVMVWAGQFYPTTLTAEGGYTCLAAGNVYTGTWHIDQRGRFILRETRCCDEIHHWTTYSIRLDLNTLEGHTEGAASPGTSVRLLRKNPY